jgi:hypothetical protein
VSCWTKDITTEKTFIFGPLDSRMGSDLFAARGQHVQNDLVVIFLIRGFKHFVYMIMYVTFLNV